MQPSYKACAFELLDLKSAAGGWSFSGYASTFLNTDEGGDIVMPGAFKTSLKNRPRPKLLWQHQSSEPIGTVVSLTEDDRGLKGEWEIVDTQRGTDAYKLLKKGAIDSLSIGYLPVDAEFKDSGVRELKEVDLLEVSVVTIPMNEEALITNVKSMLHDMPFDLACRRVAAFLEQGAVEAKALRSRRSAVNRDLAERHQLAIEEVLSKAEAWMNELKALTDGSEAPVPEPNVEREPTELSITQIRLQTLRKNFVRRGLLEYASA